MKPIIIRIQLAYKQGQYVAETEKLKKQLISNITQPNLFSLLSDDSPQRDMFFLFGDYDALLHILREGWLSQSELILSVFPLGVPGTQPGFLDDSGKKLSEDSYILQRIQITEPKST